MDALVAKGHMESLKPGPVYWIDSADMHPCMGTAGSLQWHLKAVGKLFHSGLPHRGINALEMGMAAVKVVQERFYADFPAHPEEERYKFMCPSTIKPTQMECSKGSLNQLPAWATISGDIRLTPFYDVKAVVTAVERYVAEINAAPDATLEHRGPCSKYSLPEGDVLKGTLELSWGGHPLAGIACNIDSAGHKALVAATAAVLGEAKPYSITGSLPLVKELQDAGFDVQISGYGLTSTYHANNEYCHLSHMQQAIKIFSRIVTDLEAK